MKTSAARTEFSAYSPLGDFDAANDPRVIASGILNALLDIDGHVSRQRQGAVLDTLAETFAVSDEDARELAIMGAWLAARADTAEDSLVILSRQLRGMRGGEALAIAGTMDAMITAVMADERGSLSGAVQAALRTATIGHA